MRKARGFTLLELLVATALFTVLMVGVSAVIASLRDPDTAARVGDTGAAATSGAADAAQPGPDALVLSAWVELLREDLRHTATVQQPGPNRLTLTGYGALEPGRRERSHRPVSVRYELRTIGGRRWVVRRQAALDRLTNQNIQYDLVCAGVERFEIVDAEGVRPGSLPTELLAAAQTAPGDGESLEQGDAAAGGDGPVAQRAGSPDDLPGHVRVHGLPVFLRYVPQWRLDELAREAGGQSRVEVDDGRGGDGAGGAAASADTDASTPTPRPVWRLRVWTADTEAPALERVVALPAGGGL